jgi:hypothetical protein
MFTGLNQLQMGQMGQMGQMPVRYTPLENMMQGYLPMGMNMNMALMNMGLNNPQMMMQQPNLRPFQNLFSEQVKVYNNKANPVEIKNVK